MKERIVRAVAGIIVLASIALTYFVNLQWLWLGVFVGLNLLQSSFTKFCPLEKILKAAGVESDKKKELLPVGIILCFFRGYLSAEFILYNNYF